jgi:acyl-CoA synthetase (AMP-forming)/AMP-acid ligase II
MTDFSSFTYPRLLQHQAESRPEQLAVVTPMHRVTWRQLRDDAARIGGGLLDLGIAPGSKVAMRPRVSARSWCR